MPKEPLFVYGTFRDHSTLDAVVGHTIVYKQAILPDYYHEELRNGYSNLRPHLNRNVEGFLVMLTPAELVKADKWETRYERRSVRLKGGEEAWAYFEKRRGK